MTTIAILACEVSGDKFATALMQQIWKKDPSAKFVGIGGDRMREAGFDGFADANELTFLGLASPLILIKVWQKSRLVIRKLLDVSPDVIIGIDSPHINFKIEKACKQANIPVLHWASPSVWASGKYRIKKSIQSCDEVLCLFPNETQVFHQQGHPASFIGHYLADMIPLQPNPQQALKSITQDYPKVAEFENKQVICMMPGSRQREIDGMASLFLEVALALSEESPELRFVLPVAINKFDQQIKEIVEKLPVSFQQKLQIIEGKLAHQAIEMSDTVLLSFGTGTLESILYKKKMLVVYNLHWFEEIVIKLFYFVNQVSLPNYLAGGDYPVVGELLGRQANKRDILKRMCELINKPNKNFELFTQIHQRLARNSVVNVAEKLQKIIEQATYKSR